MTVLEISATDTTRTPQRIRRRLVMALDRAGLAHTLKPAPEGRLLLELSEASPAEVRYVRGLLEGWDQSVGVVVG